VLWEELLWMSEQEHRPTTRLAEIQDDVSIRQRGVCYLSPSQLEQGQTWVLDRLARVAGAQKLYQQRVRLQSEQSEQSEQPQQIPTSSSSSSPRSPGSHLPNHSIEWRPRAVQRYLKLLDRFLELLCLAVHITSGQPARGPELLSVRWRNSVLQDRNLYIIAGQVAIVTRYHKTQSQ
jgi:hypothetical protein